MQVHLVCPICQKQFTRFKSRLRTNQTCCSVSCGQKLRNQGHHLTLQCSECGTEFQRMKAHTKSKNIFCSQQCQGKHTARNRDHRKTKCHRRSKLELWIQMQLSQLYPQLNILYNDKFTINSELDIYIPSRKLAFELNGIYHYEPIHGKDKLHQIQNNDNRKFQACLENNIELCIIDTSSFRSFANGNANKYLDIITNIISKSEG